MTAADIRNASVVFVIILVAMTAARSVVQNPSCLNGATSHSEKVIAFCLVQERLAIHPTNKYIIIRSVGCMGVHGRVT